MFFVPESPRFLISVGRTDEARIVLDKLRSNKDTQRSAIDAELVEMKTQIDWGELLPGVWADEIEHENLTCRWVDLVNTRPNLRRTVVACMVQAMAV